MSRSPSIKPPYKVRFIQNSTWVDVYIIKNISKQHLTWFIRNYVIYTDIIAIGANISNIYLYVDKYFLGYKQHCSITRDAVLEAENTSALTRLSSDNIAEIISCVISNQIEEPNALYIQYLKDYLVRLCDECEEVINE